MNSSRHNAIFFDFDGVIVESIAIKTEAFSAFYAPYGPDVLAAALVHHESFEGISRLIKFRHCHKTLLGIDLDDDALDELARAYTADVEDRIIACDGVSGAEEFLARYHEKFHLFVVSGTPEVELQRIVDARNLSHYFTEVRGSPDTKDVIVGGLLERYALIADRTLFVGDAMADFNAARECDVPFIGRVAPGRRSLFPDGTSVIEDLTTLPDIVKKFL